MRVVSDTSPLHYLVSVQHEELLPQLFEQIYVPPAVILELSHVRTPIEIRRWITSHPHWLVLHPLSSPLNAFLSLSLDQGEAEAIQLAEEQNASILIMDEWKGRAVAQSRGVPLVGVLGILGLAYQRRLLEDPLSVLNAMRVRGFRIHDKLASRFAQFLGNQYAR